MSDILETAMLICFGCSWPLSVINNIKAKTSKSMSLPFILLITFGYLAGITAKIITGKINFVLIVYIINLLFVSCNIVVYFINRSIEKNSESDRMGENYMLEKDINKIKLINEKYTQMNSIAKLGATVFFGSTAFSKFPVCELARSFGLEETIYNRSVNNLSIYETSDILHSCVINLYPKKLFIEIGEYDIQKEDFDLDDFISKYEWLLYSIHKEIKSKIYILSTFGKNANNVNKCLQKLAHDTGCEYIDTTEAMQSNKPELKLFNQLRFYLRDGNIDFFDAMNSITIT